MMNTKYLLTTIFTLCMIIGSCTQELEYESLSKQDLGNHPYVEIGGKKWSTMNMGAKSVAGSYTTCVGDYYTYAELTPRYNTITLTFPEYLLYDFYAICTWKEKYTNGYYSGTGTASSYPYIILQTKDDAATQNWGEAWHIPTQADFIALAKACGVNPENFPSGGNKTDRTIKSKITEGGIYYLTKDQKYIPEYTGVAGLLFVAKDDINKMVFFPSAGYFSETDLRRGGSNGIYWISDRNQYSIYQRALNFSDDLLQIPGVGVAYQGYPIRPVAD